MNFSVDLVGNVDKGQTALGMTSEVGDWGFRKFPRSLAHSNRNTNVIADTIFLSSRVNHCFLTINNQENLFPTPLRIPIRIYSQGPIWVQNLYNLGGMMLNRPCSLSVSPPKNEIMPSGSFHWVMKIKWGRIHENTS